MEYKILAITWVFLLELVSILNTWVHWRFNKKLWSDYEEGKSTWTGPQFMTGLFSLLFRYGIFFYLFNLKI